MPYTYIYRKKERDRERERERERECVSLPLLVAAIITGALPHISSLSHFTMMIPLASPSSPRVSTCCSGLPTLYTWIVFNSHSPGLSRLGVLQLSRSLSRILTSSYQIFTIHIFTYIFPYTYIER